MHTRRFDFNTLFDQTLQGDLQAAGKFLMHLMQGEFTQNEIRIIIARTDSEVIKSDRDCNVHALNLRAYMHQNGKGGSVDYAAAIALYNRAIALGNATAMSNRAYMHEHAQGGSVDYAAAIALYNRAIALGNATAMSNRAYMHEHAQGGSVDYAAAIALYDRAIALGDATAMINRAYTHQNGEGGSVDYAAAIALYDRAIALGNTSAMNNRAYMHLEGKGGPVDYAAAIALYDRAIALGSAGAMVSRAYMHVKGEGGPVDYAAAIALYDRAIALGNTTAMSNRAYMHAHAQGGPVDYAAAIALYNRAIALGNATAMSNRADMHREGEGGLVNLVEAARLYRKVFLCASPHDKTYAAANKAIEHLSNSLSTDNLQGRYHVSMVRQSFKERVELFKLDPATWVSFILNDDLLSQKDKYQYIDKIEKSCSEYSWPLRVFFTDRVNKDTSKDKKVALDLLAKMYMDQAYELLADQTIPVDANNPHSVSATLLDEVLAKLKQVSAESSLYSEALFMQADILYNAVVESDIQPEYLSETLTAVAALQKEALEHDASNSAVSPALRGKHMLFYMECKERIDNIGTLKTVLKTIQEKTNQLIGELERTSKETSTSTTSVEKSIPNEMKTLQRLLSNIKQNDLNPFTLIKASQSIRVFLIKEIQSSTAENKVIQHYQECLQVLKVATNPVCSAPSPLANRSKELH